MVQRVNLTLAFGCSTLVSDKNQKASVSLLTAPQGPWEQKENYTYCMLQKRLLRTSTLFFFVFALICPSMHFCLHLFCSVSTPSLTLHRPKGNYISLHRGNWAQGSVCLSLCIYVCIGRSANSWSIGLDSSRTAGCDLSGQRMDEVCHTMDSWLGPGGLFQLKVLDPA